MNTQNSIVKNRIRAYIFDCMNFDGYEVDIPERYSEHVKIRECHRIFMNEVGWNRIKQNGDSRMKAFEYWLRGLCSVLPVEFVTREQGKLLVEWTEDDKWMNNIRYTVKIDDIFWYLIAREFWAMYDRIGG